MKARDRSYPIALSTGLNTTRVEQTSEAPVLRVARNVRFDRGAALRRPGMVRLAQVTSEMKGGNFDGSNDTLSFHADPRIWPLGTRWTVETLARAETISGTHTIFGGAGVNPGLRIQMDTTSSNRVVVSVRDSAGTTTTLAVGSLSTGVVYAIQVVRDGASLTLRVNGTETTGTMSATNALDTQEGGVSILLGGVIGGTSGGSLFDGDIDFVRVFSTAKTHQRDGYRRLLNPRADDVLVDIVTGPDANGCARDRSRYGNHAKSSNPPTAATSIALNPAPIQGIAQRLKANGSRELVVVAGGAYFPVAVK